AGGYLAACTALVKDFDEKNEDFSISSVPNAMVLFNPRLDLVEVVPILPKKVIRYLKGRAIEVSPIHNVSKGAPPTIIFQGTADESALVHGATRFCAEMKKYGNNCEVVPYEGRNHGFFLKSVGDEDFTSTMEHTVKFLTSIGYIKGDTTIKK
ncbi:MAG: prolyl oligopeptidase family serine peptidase, partial [Bacteroidia bacterium]|nr:prolyl oligopeptidase family serine peptidase [Bacteroidia bacterium]